jgi:hypothetical protein
MSNGAAPDTITCIYCRKVGPPSREHVLARSLGGNATAWITCAQCNTVVLSAVDNALAERSLIALARIAGTPASAFDAKVGGDHFHYDEERDIHEEVSLTNEFRSVPFPQIHFRLGTTNVMVIAPDQAGANRLAAFIDRKLADGTLRQLHVKVGPPKQTTTARLVMHREKEGFVRVASQGDELRVFDALDKYWPEMRAKVVDGSLFTSVSTPTPTIQAHLPIRPDDANRAIAKTALNVLAMDVGREFALSPEFDDLRNFIRGTDIRHPERLAKDEIAVDTRFVRALPYGMTPPVPTTEHAVTFFYEAPRFFACVTLYEKHSFLVTMGSIALSEAITATHEFSTVRKGHEALDVLEIYDRISKK